MHKKIKVAITDDHDIMRKSISNFFREMDFEIVIEASNAEDLLEKLIKSEALPEVCLLDYNMPGIKGDALAAILTQKYPDIRLAAFTANTTLDCLIDMIGNGCKSYFIKNGDPREWEAGIKELLEKGYYYTVWMQQTLLFFIQNNYKSLNDIYNP